MNKKEAFGKNVIVFTGGGTGGHIFPGLAVADELAAKTSLNLIWFGSNQGIDKQIVQKSESISRFVGIPSGKLRRYFSFQNLADSFKIAAGFFVSFFMLLRLKPVAVFSKGGFVSVPVCFAAGFLKVPVFTHECDFSPGLATKLNALFAKYIFVSFEQTASFFNKKQQAKITVTGNPIRSVFYTANAEKGKQFLNIPQNVQKPILFVSGGSLGAQQINELILQNIEWLCERFILVHQTGKAFEENITPAQKNKLQNQKDYYSYAFIYDEMPHVLAAADIVISRAGSNTVWENAATGKAMILIPLSGSGTRGDQIENAAFFLKKNAALVLTKERVTGENLKYDLELLHKKENREVYSTAAKNLCGKEKPACKIAEFILQEISD